MKKKTIMFTLTLLFCLTCVGQSLAQDNAPPPTAEGANCTKAKGFAIWINCKVYQAVETKINQREPTKQTETPSISESSTSLVDQSSGPDLIGAALNLVGFTDTPGGTQQKSYSFTASWYSLYSTILKRDPLAPSFYTSNRMARSVYFTLGQEIPDDTEMNNTERANIYGVKVLLWDRRDASHPANRARLKPVVDQMKAASVNFNRISLNILGYLTDAFVPAGSSDEAKAAFRNSMTGEGFQGVFDRLSAEDLERIDQIIDENLDAEIELTTTVRRVVEEIRKGAQFSIATQFKTRKEGADEYKGEAILDLGLSKRVNGTVNASFIYVNSSAIGADTRGFCGSGQLKFQVTPEKRLTGREPVYLNISGEGKWMSGMDAIGKVQGKITIPIVEGINLPISFTWATRTELIDEQEVRGQFGITFDLAKLAKQFGFK